MENFGEILKEHRIARGLTLKDVEKGTGINNGNLSRWERGEVIPSIDFCVRIADFYEITIDELLGHDFLSKEERAAGASITKKVSITPIEDDILFAFREIGKKYGEKGQRVALSILEGLLKIK